MISIVPTIREKIKHLLEWAFDYEIELFIGAVVVLSAGLAFGVGRYFSSSHITQPVAIRVGEGSSLSGNASSTDDAVADTIPVTVQTSGIVPVQPASVFMPIDEAQQISSEQFPVVGTRSSKKYRMYWCPDAKKVSAKNRVLFRSKADAEKAGYVPVKNCKGM